MENIFTENIQKLDELFAQKNAISKEISSLSSAPLDNTELIPQIYIICNNYCNNKIAEDMFFRNQFVFIVYLLFEPTSFFQKARKKNIRNTLARLFNLAPNNFVPRNIYSQFKLYRHFRYSVKKMLSVVLASL